MSACSVSRRIYREMLHVAQMSEIIETELAENRKIIEMRAEPIKAKQEFIEKLKAMSDHEKWTLEELEDWYGLKVDRFPRKSVHLAEPVGFWDSGEIVRSNFYGDKQSKSAIECLVFKKKCEWGSTETQYELNLTLHVDRATCKRCQDRRATKNPTVQEIYIKYRKCTWLAKSLPPSDIAGETFLKSLRDKPEASS